MTAFPFFGPAYISRNRLTIAGCPRAGKSVKDMLRRQMGDIYFPVDFDGLPARFRYLDYCRDEIIRIRKSRVYMIENNHPGEAISFRIVEKGKSVVYMTDNELFDDRKGATPFPEFVDFVKSWSVKHPYQVRRQ